MTENAITLPLYQSGADRARRRTGRQNGLGRCHFHPDSAPGILPVFENGLVVMTLTLAPSCPSHLADARTKEKAFRHKRAPYNLAPSAFK